MLLRPITITPNTSRPKKEINTVRKGIQKGDVAHTQDISIWFVIFSTTSNIPKMEYALNPVFIFNRFKLFIL
jgi:hypothetical protein